MAELRRTLGPMGIAAKHIDRLLPRHESADNADLSWHVHTERQGLFKKEEVSTPATIQDISLEGALVEVQSTTTHEIGDKIAVRFRGLDGHAVIKHCRPGDDGTVLFGVNFQSDPTFKDAVNLAVGELRGHSAELTMAWHTQN